MAAPVPNSNKQWKKIGVDIFSGFCSGISVTVVGHPFETLKVRLQTQPQGADKVYNGFTDCIKKTWQWEGMRGFYKGVSSPLALQLFLRSVQFFANGSFIRYWSNNGQIPMSYMGYALGGSVTWSVCTLIECPLQLSSSQMQVQIVKQKSIPNYQPAYKNVFDCLFKITRSNGILGIYQGFVPQLIRNVGGGAFHFGLFEMIRREYAKYNQIPVEKIGLTMNLVAGGVGGFFFWFVTYPVDVVKSAIQSDSADPSKRKYKGTIDAFQQLYKEGGWKRFTRGFSAAAARAFPANAVLLTTAMRLKEIGYQYI